MNIVDDIKRTIGIQSESLNLARKSIGPSYRSAVETLYRCKGKIIVTGVGKSGLVAEKIASTLASTGTPAIFLHPVEAMHGNLGIVNKNDVILAIGKSGESDELLAILPSLKKIGTKIICLTANHNSSLARHSSIILNYPIKREACPLNLAPTTSSTLSMVIGDALSIALMKLRGFSSEKFALYHPGGTLGKRLLLTVSDIMRRGNRNPKVSLNASVDRLLLEMTKKWTGAASIVDKRQRLVGLVTDFDVRRAIRNGRSISELQIRNIMNSKPKFIYAHEMAIKAFQIMEARKKPFTVLPVVDRKKRSVGMVHLHDLISRGLVDSSAA